MKYKLALTVAAVVLSGCCSTNKLQFSDNDSWSFDREQGIVTNRNAGLNLPFFAADEMPRNLEDCSHDIHFVTGSGFNGSYKCSTFIKECLSSIPLPIDSIHYILADKIVVFEYGRSTTIYPDYVISEDGSYINRLYGGEIQEKELLPDSFWRNLYISTKAHRILCVDRMLLHNRPVGILYILQSYIAKYPFCSLFNFDVSDPRNMESVAPTLDQYREISLRILKSNGFDPKALE